MPLLYKQVTKLNSKLEEAQRFKAVFCVGEFTAEELDATEEPPVPVYFIDAGPGCAELIKTAPKGLEIRPGLHFLGHFGVKRIAGLSIAYLSGRYQTENFPEAVPTIPEGGAGPGPSWEEIRAAEAKIERARKELYYGASYTPVAIEQLQQEIQNSGGVDLLLTSEWPTGCLKGVPKEARTEIVDKEKVFACCSPAVAEVAAAAEPKYHAVGLAGVFWRRLPWQHERRGEVVAATGQLRCGACRMVAMGIAGSGASASSTAPPAGTEEGAPQQPPQPKQQKWLHGLELDPYAPPARADDATPCPWAKKETPKEAAAGEKQEVWRPSFGMADSEERRRWLKRMGATPDEMLSASDKLQADADKEENKEKKKKRQSLYPTEKDNKKKRGGAGEHETFAMRERRAAMGKHAGGF